MQPKPPGRAPLAGPSYQPPSNPPVGATFGNLPSSNPPVGNRPPAPGGSEQRMQSSNQYLRTPVVRYANRMRVGKLHPVEVTLAGSNGMPEPFKPQAGALEPPMVVQLTVPGAIVTPPHVIIPISGGVASFVVQPLMKGKLSGAKVEFLAQGRKVSEIALPMRANKGTLAKFLFLFAIALPFLIHFLPTPSYYDRGRVAENPMDRRPLPGNENSKDGAGNKTGMPPGKAPGKGGPGKNEAVKSDPAKNEAAKNDPSKTEPTKADPAKNEINKSEPAKNEKNEKSKENGKPAAQLDRSRTGQRVLPGATPQPPVRKDEFGSKIQRGGQGGGGATATVAPPPTEQITMLGTTYNGEDAIWAWIRTQVERAGYDTERVKMNTESMDGLTSLVTADRRYQIVGENVSDWGTGRVVAMGLYYCEPVLRLIYRLLIVFPKNFAFGELIYAGVFLLLAILVWLFTGPSRRKIKGSLMDIRLAGA